MKKMSKTLKIIIMVFAVLLIAGITVFAATMGKSNSSYVRIREKATTESEVLDVLMEGDQVEILGEEGDWYKISAKGHTGYVSKTFITKNDGAQNSANNNDNENNNANSNADNNTNQNTNNSDNKATTTRTATITTKVYKVAENTQVYILPILSSESIGTVNAGEDLDLLSSAGLWGYIKTSNVKGWVRIDKLSSEDVTKTVTEEVPAEQNKEQENAQNNEENNEQNTAESEKTTNTEAKEENKEENKTEEKAENNNTETNNEQNNNTEPEKQTTENNAQVQETKYEEKTMYVSTTAINVRKEANTTSEVVSGAALNATFTVVGEENGWYKVKVNGDYGYIRKDLLSDSKTEETSRSGLTDRNEAVKQSNNAQSQNNTSTANNNAAVSTTTQTTSTQAANTQAANTQAANTQAANTQAANTQAAAASQNQTTNTTQAQTTAKSSSGVTGADIVAYAQQFVGCRYVYGAAGPSSFDCSGFTMYVYKHFGYSLSHSSRVQATQGVKVTGELQPGDILVFSNDGKQVGHVGLYIGNDKFIHASDSTTGVIISNLHDSWNIKKYWGARRIL